MDDLGRRVTERAEQILDRYVVGAKLEPAAAGLDRAELKGVLPRFLAALFDEDAERRRELVELHASTRMHQGFGAGDAVGDYGLLGRCIVEVMEALPPPALGTLLDRLREAEASTARLFADERDAQLERRYLRRLLQEAARSGPRLLDEALALLSESVQGSCAGLYAPDGDASLRLRAHVGGCLARDSELPQHQFWREVTQTPGVLAGGTPIAALFGGALRDPESHQIVAARLFCRGRLVGVIHVGVHGKSALGVGARTRLATLAWHAATLFDEALGGTELQARVTQLETEKQLRERFVAILAHDLRGPLSAARVYAAMLRDRTHEPGRRQQLSDRLVGAIEHADQMVRDLLDANRINAGERLAIRCDAVDVVALVRDLVEELTTIYGPRFEVIAPLTMHGFWSRSELRRALWNLATNAVKYGAADRPVRLRVQREDDWIYLSVHNEGPPLSDDDLGHMFDPFARGASARAVPVRGWGLGLTLVRGAAESHGGRVLVDSGASGTTFTLKLPMDARLVAATQAAL